MSFLGAPYPVVTHPRGFFRTQSGLDTIRSDLLILLQTTPGERVMLPAYGTALKTLIYDQNDAIAASTARSMIIEAINTWEPRIVVQSLEVSIGSDIPDNSLNSLEDSDKENIMFISIEFSLLDNITEVQELTLEIPLAG